MNIDTTQAGKFLLRYGFVFVFLWFGVNQVLKPDAWTGLIPTWVTAFSGMSAHTIVLINGGVEIVFALLLVFNLYTPIVSILLSLHLLTIAIDLKFSAVGIRDLGLAISMLALGLLTWKDRE